MANIKSQKKRVLTNEKAHIRNVAVKSELKTLIRKTREATDAKDITEAKNSLKAATTKLDIAVSKGVIHKNQAANRKSALYSAVNKIA
ncbi:30S ribosomal protein S20 [Actinomycetota bacterium]|nr:30S ribosomal protein S20 [Actinomycetota bacterium]